MGRAAEDKFLPTAVPGEKAILLFLFKIGSRGETGKLSWNGAMTGQEQMQGVTGGLLEHGDNGGTDWFSSPLHSVQAWWLLTSVLKWEGALGVIEQKKNCEDCFSLGCLENRAQSKVHLLTLYQIMQCYA